MNKYIMLIANIRNLLDLVKIVNSENRIEIQRVISNWISFKWILHSYIISGWLFYPVEPGGDL